MAFETERLRMRPLEADDEGLVCGLYMDGDTMRFIAAPLSPEQALRRFRNALKWSNRHPPECVFLAIFDRAMGRSLGFCAIVQFETGRTRAEVGIMLKSDARARGYAREGLGGLVKQTFSVFQVNEIWVKCSARNPIVERMVSSIGFTLCNGSTIDTGPLSQRIWSVHRSSWSSTNIANNQRSNHV